MPISVRWTVPVEWSAEESALARKLHRIGKCYVFLRTIRHELFDEAFQAQLGAVYQPRGTRLLPPALLAMALLLQAYDQVGDAEAVVSTAVDPRWQLALGCLGAERAPFSQGALVAFRERLIAHDLDKALLDKTVALAKARGGFGSTSAQRWTPRRCSGPAGSRTRGISSAVRWPPSSPARRRRCGSHGRRSSGRRA